MSYVQINHLSKKFGQQTVLQQLDLTLEKGQLITLLGPSGCGKSTLLRIISGLSAPDSGTIRIDGKDITTTRPKDREIGMVFQSYALFPNLTVAENISFGLEMKKMPMAQIRRSVQETIELVGLQGKEKAFPHELSGGQQQRVALARSLVTRPKVLLLDEPLSALDAQIRKTLQKQLRSIQRELSMTTVLVTHDQEEAMAVSDRICIMDAGRIVQQGTPHEIYTRPRCEFVARFIGSYNVLTAEELLRLAPEFSCSSAKLYAIRPETLRDQEMEDGIAVTGTVDNVTMLGNITRYEISAVGVRLFADYLHHSWEPQDIGRKKTIYLDPKDVIPLDDASA
ncbi:heme ABC exporter ATP-binding protein CcmA [Brevibacillus massiliensis]|jgi:putative spermidine/putrescine transport system ATP-binding protein|uniref:heme ABC exporter ATP-binding protein CcmA n=1 Tax=Brevibacillus massiliensis TaxID=1118054 RepID=UPI0002ED09A2|nr:heme ABC exporter ATP-binding protein CcmA [Brevibacillus massiliensis]